MQTTQAPPRLPGVRATTPFLINALVTGPLFLPLVAPLIGLMTVEATQAGGHLPWPVAQWMLTTPAGLVGILAICVGVGAPTFIVVQRHVLRGWMLARAVDVTRCHRGSGSRTHPSIRVRPAPIAGSAATEEPAWSI